MTWHEKDQKNVTENNQKSSWEEQLNKRWEDLYQQFKAFFHYIQGQFSFNTLFNYLVPLLIIIWIVSGFYIIEQGNRGVVTRFGAYADTSLPGPHWHMPFPLENVQEVNVEQQRYIEVGYRSGNRRNNSVSVLPEALMLSKDENIVSLRLAVQYQIKDAKAYLFNVKGSESTLKQVTESVERGVIGRNNMDFILTEGRSQIVSEVKNEIQTIMDEYGAGLRVTSVNLQDAQPPEQVQSAFEDAIRAREDKQRLINEAQAYANEVIPKARGAAARMVKEAEGYEAQVVAYAQGESQRFDQLLTEYQKAPKITRKRLYLEAKEKLYRNNNKVLVNVEKGNNMFYMPLNSLPQSSHSQLSPAPVHNKKTHQYKTVKTKKSSIRSSRGQK